jgi:hypothetical protein
MSLFESIKNILITVENLVYLIDLLLLVIVIILIRVGWKFHPRFDDVLSGTRKKKEVKTEEYNINEEWIAVKERSLSAVPKSYLMGIIEADALLDKLLIRMGVPGDTVMDRLRAISKSSIMSLHDLFEAHRTRNIIAHAPGTLFPPHELEQTFFAYEAFFKEIKVIK